MTDLEKKEKNKEYYKKQYQKNKEKIKIYTHNNKEKKKEYDTNYRKKNAEKVKNNRHKYYKKNKDKIKEYSIENKENKKIYMKIYRENNKLKIKENKKEYDKKYSLENKEKLKEKSINYYQNNKEKVKEKIRKYEKNRKKTDPLFKLTCNIRTSIGHAIKKQGYTKKSKTYQILGCTFEEFKQHLERQFALGMTWHNQGEWHLDHIYPVSLAKDEQELIKLNHYTNFQPLWAKDNLEKHNKIIPNTQIKLI
jgi:hypothetical protein